MSLADASYSKFCCFVLSLCWLPLLTGCASVPSPSGVPELNIPFEKHVLENGLTVIIHEDHSDPVAHVDVTYHVGSAREELGKSGFAHLFEHMMFQGSENVGDDEHIKTVNETGGSMNGSTNRDRTNYYETVPSNHLETMLWLEADRMGLFLEGITQEKFEIQRETVKNEKQQNYDNRAYGRTSELITKSLYPYGHPYSWLTIGDLEDLDSATADDLKHFFLRWYGPNNATLTIGGDVYADDVMPLVEKYFGSIAKGPKVEPLDIPDFQLKNDRYVSYYDDKIRFPALIFNYPTVKKFHPDAPALACLAGILGRGKGSYLYQNFINTQKAISTNASHDTDELAGKFSMFVLPYPGLSLADFETELRRSLEEFEQNGVSDSDLEKFKARYERNYINGLETVAGKVRKLAYYQTFTGDPGKTNEQLQAYLSVTKEDVMRVYQRYIKNKPAVILSVLNDPDGVPAKADNYVIPTTGKNIYPTVDYSNLKYTKPKDSFDRSVPPAAQPAKLVSPPEYWRAELAHGIKVIGSEQNELPKIYFNIRLKGGHILDQNTPGTLGLSALSIDMLNTSTANFSEKEIAEELEKIGSRIDISTSNLYFNINVSSLTKNIDRTLELLEEKVFRPAFLANDFKRIQQQVLESAKSSTQQASSIAEVAWDRLIYGSEHIKGIPPSFIIPTVSKLTEADAKAFYEKNFSFRDAEIVVVGNISKKEFLSKMNVFTKLDHALAKQPDFAPTPTYDGTTLFLIDKPGAAQSEIRIGYLTDLPYDATGEFYKRYLMNFTLGGAFNSRINLNLREDKALSYGAGSYFEGSEIPGAFTAYSSVKREGTDIAITELIKEISKMKESGISDDELHFLKDAIGQGDALKYESSYQKAGFLAKILHFNIPKSFVDEQAKIIKNITKDDIASLAKQYLPLEKMVILVVGDKAHIYDGLSKLDYNIIELDSEGGPLN